MHCHHIDLHSNHTDLYYKLTYHIDLPSPAMIWRQCVSEADNAIRKPAVSELTLALVSGQYINVNVLLVHVVLAKFWTLPETF